MSARAIPLWTTIYPTVAAVQAAHIETLAQWDEHLPAPQTDVERTVRRRVALRYDELARELLAKEAPEVVGKLNEIIDRMTELGIPHNVKRFQEHP